ncbi:hypothetical protein Csa_018444 [Cucumis sativus]|uniref:Uncharacterized protein n=1 Tax=Cucumis sativus TaxID=3659 RepID=A0A0A0KMM5_CUCSA|nr:hypothetical protein Csa_018444 [Cucumis sativus]
MEKIGLRRWRGAGLSSGRRRELDKAQTYNADSGQKTMGGGTSLTAAICTARHLVFGGRR